MESSNKQIVSLRCPGDRPHGIYETCGKLLLAYDEDKLYVYCSQCKQYYEVEVLPNLDAKMQILPKNERLDLVNNLRVVE